MVAMKLRDDIQQFIDEQVKSGRFPNAESLITEAVDQLRMQLAFPPGELDRLIAEGEAGAGALDGDSVLKEFEQLRMRSKAG